MNNLKKRYGKWALVTGASSGMGKEFAYQLAQEGVNIALLARRKDKLDALGQTLTEQYGIECLSVVADLASADFLPTVVKQTEALEIGILINNAGFTNHGFFLDNELEAESRLVDVNCRAATQLAHHYGGLMRQRKRGAILFTASVVGFTSVPIWSTYAASKGYELLLAEALASELKPHNIDVIALCPGSTRTEFANYQGLMAELLVMEPEKVVRGAIKSIGKRRVYIAGLINRLTVFSTRLMPRRMSAAIFSKLVRDMVHD